MNSSSLGQRGTSESEFANIVGFFENVVGGRTVRQREYSENINQNNGGLYSNATARGCIMTGIFEVIEAFEPLKAGSKMGAGRDEIIYSFSFLAMAATSYGLRSQMGVFLLFEARL